MKKKRYIKPAVVFIMFGMSLAHSVQAEVMNGSVHIAPARYKNAEQVAKKKAEQGTQTANKLVIKQGFQKDRSRT